MMVFYLVLSFGISVSLHFCGNRVSDFSFISDAHPCVVQCGKHQIAKKSCCKTSSVQFSIEDEHSGTDEIKAPSLVKQVFVTHFESYTLSDGILAITYANPRDGPILSIPQPKKYIAHQSLLFYS